MNSLHLWPLLVPVAGLAVLLAAWWLYRLGQDVQTERAKEAFRLQRERLAEMFLLAANQSGKPRGLRWAEGTMTGELVLVRDRRTRKFTGLVAMDIRLDPLPDGDMEECEASKIPRTITAVFHFRAGEWLTEGRAIFNMSPDQAMSNFDQAEQSAENKGRSGNF
ncbi:hypothetical protein [Zavarzinella formosa]|uniref:hypothetical protein n=1 Tax=Zavarzinella formosa TaxID=360055 RepID=UPI0002DD81EC|nr:hypothetical protein [Zavarzinella formosa]